MIDNNFGYYECSICGHQTQIITEVPKTIEHLNEETQEISTEEVIVLELDGEASFQAASEHEETHK